MTAELSDESSSGGTAQQPADARPERQTILLIGGRPRSGTTLLSNLIQRQLNIPVAPETHFFDIVMTKGMDALPAEVTEDPALMSAYTGLPATPPASPTDTFRLLLDRLIPQPALTIGEKTPDHMGKFKDILGADPVFKAVVIVRNCADVCESLARMPWNNNTFEENLRLWVLFYRDGLRLRKNFPGRVEIVRYERLCAQPEQEVARLAKSLGLKANADQLTPGTNYDAVREPWKQGADGPVKRPGRTFFRWTPASKLSLRQYLFAHLSDAKARLKCLLRPPY